MPAEPPPTGPRLTLLQTTFSDLLPSLYNLITTHWTTIACLTHEAKAALLATERDTATNSLRAELDLLQKDIDSYRTLVQGFNVTDIAGLYATAGRTNDEAVIEAKGDLADLEASLGVLEERVKEIRADLVYGRDSRRGSRSGGE